LRDLVNQAAGLIGELPVHAQVVTRACDQPVGIDDQAVRLMKTFVSK
jgi:hypothetical protein